jgi:hypothetical protein
MKSVLTAVFLIAFLQSTAQSGLSAQQWQEDLKFLQQTIHHDYPYLFKKTKAEEFDAAVDNLHRSIPELENHEIITGIARIIALFKYGHTRTGLSEEPAVFRHFPFNLYHFSDTWILHQAENWSLYAAKNKACLFGTVVGHSRRWSRALQQFGPTPRGNGTCARRSGGFLRTGRSQSGKLHQEFPSVARHTL